MAGFFDSLNVPKPGDVITSEFLEALARAATGGNVPPGGIQDATGSYGPGTHNGPYWRLAKTAANPEEGDYPKPEDSPNSYWFKFLKVDLTTTPLQSGENTPTLVETDEAMGLVYWLGNRYVPEGTVIRVWYVAPGRNPVYPQSRSDMWVAFDQQQVATFVTFTLRDPLPRNQEVVTAIFDEAGFWDGQQPWDPDDNPNREFNLINTGLMFPWEHGIDEYPAGTKGSACLDPESTKATPLSYRIIFMSYPNHGDDSDSDPSNDTSDTEVTIDVVVCDPWNRCGKFLVFPQRRLYLPAGTRIETLPNTVVPIYECQSSDDPSVSDSTPPDPSDSSAEPDAILVAAASGSLDPVAAEGVYPRVGTYNGVSLYRQGAWTVYLSPSVGKWAIFNGSVRAYWTKATGLSTPIGTYQPSLEAVGTAVVTAL